MKLAAQTVLWGNRIESIPRILDTLAMHGFQGVEFSQCPEQLGRPQDLRQMLADRKIELVGLSGGTLRDRVAYCGSVLHPEFLYMERWDEAECRAALKAGFRLALHPHVFKPVHRLATASQILTDHSELLFLPDAAHLTIAGDSPAEAVLKWRDRLAAVHLKDWTPVYGRSSHRYARGFVELGDGIINFDLLFDRLRMIDYRGWLVVEQGSPTSKPEHVLAHAASWLATRLRTMTRRRATIPSVTFFAQPATTVRGAGAKPRHHPSLYSSDEERLFLEMALRIASGDPRDCYPQLSEAIGQLLKAKLIILCACSPAADVVSVLGVHPANTKLGNNFLVYRGSLSEVAIERQAVTEFDLRQSSPGAPYHQPEARLGYPALVAHLGLQRLISVPVLNPQNPHHARLVINIFDSTPDQYYDADDLLRLGQLIAQSADAALDERCGVARASASFAAGRCQQSVAFLEELRSLILEVVGCEAMTIFLVNDSGDRLEAAVSTGIRWNVPQSEQYYDCGEGLTGTVWEKREIFLTSNPLGEANVRSKSDEAKAQAMPSGLFAPMVDVRGQVIGVVRCQNKRGAPGAFDMFSEDDVTVLDAVCQAAVPHLQVLLSKERRAKALRRLTHELSNPLHAMRDVAVLMRKELERRGQSTALFFSQDYLGDLDGWVNLMRRLLGNADFFRLSTEEIPLNRRRHYLYGDIFMPVVGQAEELLADRGFRAENIHLSKFDGFPMLWLDRNLLHQVVFNLLTNAIKYADADPNAFRVEISGREEGDKYCIDFCDWGPGINPSMKDAIFEEGVRSKDAKQKNVAGDGLGLWVARRVLSRHGGTIELTGFHKPTRFTISLPKSLSILDSNEKKREEP